MNQTKFKTREEYEKQLSQIVHSLPLERVTQVVDFARFIETQEEFEEEETEEEIQASEAKWDALLARPEAQAKMLEMAQEALADADAGRTFEMKFEDEGNLIPPLGKATK